MSMDALAEISAGTRSVEEIESIYDEIMESSDAAQVRELLGMSTEEWTAFAHGVWFDELARWRTAGWPTRCVRCGETIVPGELGWMAIEHRDEHVLAHVRCLAGPPQNQ